MTAILLQHRKRNQERTDYIQKLQNCLLVLINQIAAVGYIYHAEEQPRGKLFVFSCLLNEFFQIFHAEHMTRLWKSPLRIFFAPSAVFYFTGYGYLNEAFPPAEASRIADRIETHCTPKHGSWLNIAECELSVLGRQCLGSRRIPNLETLREEIRPWASERNAKQKGVDWQFTTEDARIKLKHLYPVLS